MDPVLVDESGWLRSWLEDEQRAIDRYTFRRNTLLIAAAIAFVIALIMLAIIPSKSLFFALPTSLLIPLGTSLIAATLGLFPIKDIKICEIAISSYRAMLEDVDHIRASSDKTRADKMRDSLYALRFDLTKRC